MIITLTKISDGGNLVPADAKKIAARLAEIVVDAAQSGIVLSGRMPIWAMAAACHAAHPAAWVATFDPRLGGGVVVQSHIPDHQVGDIVPLEGHEETTIEL
jgi:CRISPR-associated Csx3 family protein